jgi:hypothetical protein
MYKFHLLYSNASNSPKNNRISFDRTREMMYFTETLLEGAIGVFLFPFALCLCVLDPSIADWLMHDLNTETNASTLRLEIWTEDADVELLLEHTEVGNDMPPSYDDAVSNDAPPPSYHVVVGNDEPTNDD